MPDGEEQEMIARVDEDGIVTLNASAIRTVVGRLADEMRRDAVLRERFFDNPRRVLGAVGLNEQIQNELLQNEFNLGNTPFFQSKMLPRCICTDCCTTACCITTIVF